MKTTQLTLRPYQKVDAASIEEAWKSHRSVLYQLPTGGGKSIVLSKLVDDYRNEKILILAHKRRLLTQMQQHMTNIGIKAGMLIAQREENLDSNVVIASIRTAVKSKRLEMLVAKDWDKVIIDEARHSRTGSYDIVLDRLFAMHPKHKLLGVDATPYRKDKKRLDKHFEVMVVSSENIKSLQEKKFLAKEKTYATPIGEIQEQVKEVANDYQQTALSNYMRQPKFLKYVVDAYTKWGEKRQAIVFAVDKAHSKDLLAVFEKEGYKKVAQIDSDLSQDQIDKVYADYEAKKIDILINVEMLIEGVDLPETGVIVGARPTKSLTLYLQMAGRGTRPKEDGSDLIIIDCAGWTEEFGVISTPRQWSLDPDVDPNDGRKKNRIVGKTKEGKLTTDIAEMDEFSEMIEMTPEEYVAKVEGGIKEAEKQNRSIEEKIKEVETELAEMLHDAAIKGLKEKVSPFVGVVKPNKYDRDELVVVFVHKSRLVGKKKNVEAETDDDNEPLRWMEGTHVVEMDIVKRDMMYADVDDREVRNNWCRRNDQKQSIKEFREMSQVAGSLNQQIMDDKNLMMKIIEKHKTIHDLKKTKINVEELKDVQKKFEKDRWHHSIEEHLKFNQRLELQRTLDASDFFKDSWYKRIVAIQVPSGSIVTHHNTILLELTDRYNEKGKPVIEEKKYVKGEKVYELLERGQWQSTQLEIV